MEDSRQRLAGEETVQPEGPSPFQGEKGSRMGIDDIACTGQTRIEKDKQD
jgi:hypothetical protein